MEQNLFIIYCSVGYISLLRILAILHMTIILPLRWLTGNCEHLLKWEFGVADMSDVVDLMDKTFAKIQRDGNKIMYDTFMFGIFNKITKKAKPLKNIWITFLNIRKVSQSDHSRMKRR